MDALTALHKAVALHQAGDKAEAARIYEQILSAAPDHADALHLLGLIESDSGETERGVTRIRRAIELRPETGVFHKNLALILKKAGEHHAALGEYEEAARLMPDNAEAQAALGHAARRAERHDKAVMAFEAASSLAPDDASHWRSLGSARRRMNDFDGAEKALDRAVELDPKSAWAAFAMGLLRLKQQRFEDAAAEFERADQLEPDNSEFIRHVSIAYRHLGRTYDAIAVLYRSIAADPTNPRPHYDLATQLLAIGRYSEGFRGYEWRIKADPENFRHTAGFEDLRWDGSDPDGRTILVLPEQGAGDAIQFVRFVGPLAARGARVLVGETEPLKRLFGSVADCAGVVLGSADVAHFDLLIEAGSLPHLLGTTIDTIPTPEGYLSAPTDARSRWKTRLKELDRFRVGLVWAGNPNQADYKHKSVDAEAMLPLLAVEGIDWIALQVGDHANDLDSIAPGQVMNVSAELTDFAETAAIIENLDLVISVDTSVAHLAGALGRPVWTLLRFTADWRWIRYEENTPWYDSMRLFWQNSSRRWEPVIEQVAVTLRDYVSEMDS